MSRLSVVFRFILLHYSLRFLQNLLPLHLFLLAVPIIIIAGVNVVIVHLYSLHLILRQERQLMLKQERIISVMLQGIIVLIPSEVIPFIFTVSSRLNTSASCRIRLNRLTVEWLNTTGFLCQKASSYACYLHYNVSSIALVHMHREHSQRISHSSSDDDVKRCFYSRIMTWIIIHRVSERTVGS